MSEKEGVNSFTEGASEGGREGVREGGSKEVRKKVS